METLIELDKSLFLYLNNLGMSFFDPLWLVISNKWSSIPLYLIFLYLLYKNLGLQKTIITLVVVAIMITISDQLSYAVKHAVMRLRPCGDPTLQGEGRFITRCGSYGYFSGHATSSFALAVYLGMILKTYYRYIFLALLIWAFFVSYSRIYVGVHFPGDVLTGMLVGTLIGLLCYALLKFVNLRLFNQKLKTDS
mgnify:CR=1 FL=1